MPPTPDLQGFRDAMNRLRVVFGVPVTFRIPEAKTYAPDVQLDPETGEPFDPAIDPITGGGFTEVVKTVGVVTKPISPAREGGDTRFEAGGAFNGMDAVLDMAVADKPDVEAATEVTLYGEHFDIVDMKPGGLGGQVDPTRYVVYLEAK